MSDQEDDEADDILAPGLKDFLDAATKNMGMDGGFDDLDMGKLGAKLAQQRRETSQAMRKEALLFRDVFMTPAGKKLLTYLIGKTLLRAAWPIEGMTSMEMLAANGIWREAENSFVAGILEAIAVAENETPKRRSDT